jgi:hypothetical protein
MLEEEMLFIQSLKDRGYLDMNNSKELSRIFDLYKKYIDKDIVNYSTGCDCNSNYIKNLYNSLIKKIN